MRILFLLFTFFSLSLSGQATIGFNVQRLAETYRSTLQKKTITLNINNSKGYYVMIYAMDLPLDPIEGNTTELDTLRIKSKLYTLQNDLDLPFEESSLKSGGVYTLRASRQGTYRLGVTGSIMKINPVQRKGTTTQGSYYRTPDYEEQWALLEAYEVASSTEIFSLNLANRPFGQTLVKTVIVDINGYQILKTYTHHLRFSATQSDLLACERNATTDVLDLRVVVDDCNFMATALIDAARGPSHFALGKDLTKPFYQMSTAEKDKLFYLDHMKWTFGIEDKLISDGANALFIIDTSNHQTMPIRYKTFYRKTSANSPQILYNPEFKKTGITSTSDLVNLILDVDTVADYDHVLTKNSVLPSYLISSVIRTDASTVNRRIAYSWFSADANTLKTAKKIDFSTLSSANASLAKRLRYNKYGSVNIPDFYNLPYNFEHNILRLTANTDDTYFDRDKFYFFDYALKQKTDGIFNLEGPKRDDFKVNFSPNSIYWVVQNPTAYLDFNQPRFMQINPEVTRVDIMRRVSELSTFYDISYWNRNPTTGVISPQIYTYFSSSGTIPAPTVTYVNMPYGGPELDIQFLYKIRTKKNTYITEGEAFHMHKSGKFPDYVIDYEKDSVYLPNYTAYAKIKRRMAYGDFKDFVSQAPNNGFDGASIHLPGIGGRARLRIAGNEEYSLADSKLIDFETSQVPDNPTLAAPRQVPEVGTHFVRLYADYFKDYAHTMYRRFNNNTPATTWQPVTLANLYSGHLGEYSFKMDSRYIYQFYQKGSNLKQLPKSKVRTVQADPSLKLDFRMYIKNTLVAKNYVSFVDSSAMDIPTRVTYKISLDGAKTFLFPFGKELDAIKFTKDEFVSILPKVKKYPDTLDLTFVRFLDSDNPLGPKDTVTHRIEIPDYNVNPWAYIALKSDLIYSKKADKPIKIQYNKSHGKKNTLSPFVFLSTDLTNMFEDTNPWQTLRQIKNKDTVKFSFGERVGYKTAVLGNNGLRNSIDHFYVAQDVDRYINAFFPPKDYKELVPLDSFSTHISLKKQTLKSTYDSVISLKRFDNSDLKIDYTSGGIDTVSFTHDARIFFVKTNKSAPYFDLDDMFGEHGFLKDSLLNKQHVLPIHQATALRYGTPYNKQLFETFYNITGETPFNLNTSYRRYESILKHTTTSVFGVYKDRKNRKQRTTVSKRDIDQYFLPGVMAYFYLNIPSPTFDLKVDYINEQLVSNSFQTYYDIKSKTHFKVGNTKVPAGIAHEFVVSEDKSMNLIRGNKTHKLAAIARQALPAIKTVDFEKKHFSLNALGQYTIKANGKTRAYTQTASSTFDMLPKTTYVIIRDASNADKKFKSLPFTYGPFDKQPVPEINHHYDTETVHLTQEGHYTVQLISKVGSKAKSYEQTSSSRLKILPGSTYRIFRQHDNTLQKFASNTLDFVTDGRPALPTIEIDYDTEILTIKDLLHPYSLINTKTKKVDPYPKSGYLFPDSTDYKWLREATVSSYRSDTADIAQVHREPYTTYTIDYTKESVRFAKERDLKIKQYTPLKISSFTQTASNSFRILDNTRYGYISPATVPKRYKSDTIYIDPVAREPRPDFKIWFLKERTFVPLPKGTKVYMNGKHYTAHDINKPFNFKPLVTDRTRFGFVARATANTFESLPLSFELKRTQSNTPKLVQGPDNLQIHNLTVKHDRVMYYRSDGTFRYREFPTKDGKVTLSQLGFYLYYNLGDSANYYLASVPVRIDIGLKAPSISIDYKLERSKEDLNYEYFYRKGSKTSELIHATSYLPFEANTRYWIYFKRFIQGYKYEFVKESELQYKLLNYVPQNIFGIDRMPTPTFTVDNVAEKTKEVLTDRYTVLKSHKKIDITKVHDITQPFDFGPHVISKDTFYMVRNYQVPKFRSLEQKIPIKRNDGADITFTSKNKRVYVSDIDHTELVYDQNGKQINILDKFEIELGKSYFVVKNDRVNSLAFKSKPVKISSVKEIIPPNFTINFANETTNEILTQDYSYRIGDNLAIYKGYNNIISIAPESKYTILHTMFNDFTPAIHQKVNHFEYLVTFTTPQYIKPISRRDINVSVDYRNEKVKGDTDNLIYTTDLGKDPKWNTLPAPYKIRSNQVYRVKVRSNATEFASREAILGPIQRLNKPIIDTIREDGRLKYTFKHNNRKGFVTYYNSRTGKWLYATSGDLALPGKTTAKVSHIDDEFFSSEISSISLPIPIEMDELLSLKLDFEQEELDVNFNPTDLFHNPVYWVDEAKPDRPILLEQNTTLSIRPDTYLAFRAKDMYNHNRHSQVIFHVPPRPELYPIDVDYLNERTSIAIKSNTQYIAIDSNNRTLTGKGALDYIDLKPNTVYKFWDKAGSKFFRTDTTIIRIPKRPKLINTSSLADMSNGLYNLWIEIPGSKGNALLNETHFEMRGLKFNAFSHIQGDQYRLYVNYSGEGKIPNIRLLARPKQINLFKSEWITLSPQRASYIHVYPNPVISDFKLVHISEIEQIYIYDTKGDLLMQSAPKETYSITPLPAGLYYILIQMKNGEHKRSSFLKVE